MIKYLLRLMFKLPKVEIKVVEVKVEVLSPSAMSRLRKQLEQPIISGSDTGENAAYKLGIQRALNVIASGYAQD